MSEWFKCTSCGYTVRMRAASLGLEEDLIMKSIKRIMVLLMIIGMAVSNTSCVCAASEELRDYFGCTS